MLATASSDAVGAPTVAAILSPGERSRVDAAGSGCVAILHRESISDAIRMVRERPIDAVLLSVQHCGPEQVDGVAHLVREFPSVPTFALVSQYGPRATETLLLLGASGVKRVIDVTAPTGWAHLRELLTQPVTRSVARIQGPVLSALREVTPDTRIFLEAMIRLAPDTPTVRNLAKRLGVRPSTLMSRFARAELPSPKSYLAADQAAACGTTLRGPGAFHRRRGLPPRILVAPVIRAARPVAPRHHLNRVPASLSISDGSGAICNAPY